MGIQQRTPPAFPTSTILTSVSQNNWNFIAKYDRGAVQRAPAAAEQPPGAGRAGQATAHAPGGGPGGRHRQGWRQVRKNISFFILWKIDVFHQDFLIMFLFLSKTYVSVYQYL